MIREFESHLIFFEDLEERDARLDSNFVEIVVQGGSAIRLAGVFLECAFSVFQQPCCFHHVKEMIS